MVLQQTAAEAEAGKSAEEKLADALNYVADDVDEEVEQVHDYVHGQSIVGNSMKYDNRKIAVHKTATERYHRPSLARVR